MSIKTILATLLLSGALATTAQAYATQPGYGITDAALSDDDASEAVEICETPISNDMASLFGLPLSEDESSGDSTACLTS